RQVALGAGSTAASAEAVERAMGADPPAASCLLRAQAHAWLLALAIPLLVVGSAVVGHNSIGMVPLFVAGATGLRLWRAGDSAAADTRVEAENNRLPQDTGKRRSQSGPTPAATDETIAVGTKRRRRQHSASSA
ncbi:MAG: hypothetical protein M3377_09860, partial [Actinomycetota bacterium]|nr:hypothetical protein [Actinomycetota bacterium]